jgi:hypothetical protein
MPKRPVRRLISDPAQHEASVTAARAWGWIKMSMKKAEDIQRRSYLEWKKIGDGFLVGRAWAKRMAGVPEGANAEDQRLGRGYNEKFSEWLNAYGLADIDEAARSHLFKLMDSPAAQAWHAGLPDHKRVKLNHPTVIMRAWKRHNAASAFPHSDGDPAEETTKAETEQTAYEAMASQLDINTKELARLKIEAGKRCDIDLLHSDVGEIEKWLRMRVMSEHKAKRLRDVLLELYPLPLPRVPVTNPDAAAEDNIGLR